VNAPAATAASVRARIRESKDEIKRSLVAIENGRPGDAEPDKARLADVVQARNRITRTQARDVAEHGGPEAIWGDTVDFVDVAFLERGLIAAQSVCRITTTDGQAIGTGFLISPRLLLTNNHVIASKLAAQRMVAEFDYELDLAGVPTVAVLGPLVKLRRPGIVERYRPAIFIGAFN
jgi:endonuclease G